MKTGDFNLRKNNLPERICEPGNARGEGGGERPHPANRRSFMQRDQRSDDHTHQTADKKMHDFLSDVLNLFGMLIEPIGGKRFQVIDVAGKIINDPGR